VHEVSGVKGGRQVGAAQHAEACRVAWCKGGGWAMCVCVVECRAKNASLLVCEGVVTD
jgi:hypothetical protein